MNIFYLHEELGTAAKQHCDQHVRKMVLEYAQLLANCFTPAQLARVDCPRTQTGTVRKYSHQGHPSTLWTMETYGNFLYLSSLAFHTVNEYSIRFGKIHFTSNFINWVIINRELAKEKIGDSEEVTPGAIAIAQDKKCRLVEGFNDMSLVEKYRAYYVYDKLFATWKHPELIPDWFREGRERAGIPLVLTKEEQATWWDTHRPHPIQTPPLV